MLYIFSGYPGKALPAGMAHLHAGGLRHCIKEVEHLAELEEDPMIQYVKEGVYACPVGGNEGEWLGPVEYRLSPILDKDGITWKIFPEHWTFGNNVTCTNWTANRETMEVDYRTGIPFADLLASGHPIDMSKVMIQRVPRITESWKEYEKRWFPGTCPQESHKVHLTYVITKGEMEPWAYERVRRLIEERDAAVVDLDRYRPEHFSVSRKWTHPKKPGLDFEKLLRGRN